MLYFAYGSNMSIARLKKRVPSASALETGLLYEHTLAFHKIGRKDGTGKCNAHHTGAPSDYLMGVIYRIDPDQRNSLDRIEGLGNGYTTKDVTVMSVSNKEIKALTYIATNINNDLKPFHWYKHHVLYGARENKLPSDYIEGIISVESIDDPKPDRVKRELSIYSDLHF
ncbi:MAG: gamma-glutamylcyclotransferase family protein [Nitrospirota bacterium]